MAEFKIKVPFRVAEQGYLNLTKGAPDEVLLEMSPLQRMSWMVEQYLDKTKREVKTVPVFAIAEIGDRAFYVSHPNLTAADAEPLLAFLKGEVSDGQE